MAWSAGRRKTLLKLMESAIYWGYDDGAAALDDALVEIERLQTENADLAKRVRNNTASARSLEEIADLQQEVARLMDGYAKRGD